MRIVILGLSITSSWGNGHATTYRGLVRELSKRHHDVLFLERDVPWYACQRDMPEPPWGRTELYSSLEELKDRFTPKVWDADFVMVGSYVPDGVCVGEWVLTTARGVTGFYDIDTPVTLAKLGRGDCEYIRPDLIRRYDLYLSFTGGPTLRRLERQYGSPCARPLYCSVDLEAYYPEERPIRWDFGYMGTYSYDRQPPLEQLLLDAARAWPDGRFVVAGPGYPEQIAWPDNVERIEHLSPVWHRGFYNEQRFTLNITRADMVRAGYSPSVRLFEAAACGTPIIGDWWVGLDTVLRPGKEILVSTCAEETLHYLREMPEDQAREIGRRARARILLCHTAAHRAKELEGHIAEAVHVRPARRRARSSLATAGR